MKNYSLLTFIGLMVLVGCNLPGALSTPGPVDSTPTTAPIPSDDLVHYELLIISPSQFMDSLAPLVVHKNRTGMPTLLVTLEEIYRTCEGRDQAEQVKRCLALFQQKNGIRYALLVGGATLFPVRYTMADIDTPAVFNTAYFAADLYYADLYRADGSFDDWDANANDIYGEIGGEMRPGPLNIDQVDLTPDIAIGRIPVLTAEEAETYVAKVIRYELNAYNADWAIRMLLISSSSFDPGYCSFQEGVAAFFPTGMELVRLYGGGNPCTTTQPPDAANILAQMDQGVGFVSYIGHGDTALWADTLTIKDMHSLQNGEHLPIVFAGGCGTGTFTIGAPGGPYRDIFEQEHAGAQAGETFTAMPPPPAVLQPADIIDQMTVDGMMRYMLVQSPAGAVDYIGSITGAQFPALFDLNTSFFKAVSQGTPTVGDAWNSAIVGYYSMNSFAETYTNADWYVLATFHQPWKFLLFGDPSLRIGGVPAP